MCVEIGGTDYGYLRDRRWEKSGGCLNSYPHLFSHSFTNKFYCLHTKCSTLFLRLGIQITAGTQSPSADWGRDNRKWTHRHGICHVVSTVENKDSKGVDRTGESTDPLASICLSCQLVGREIISICFLNPILPLTNLLWLCLCSLFSQRDREIVEDRSCAWPTGTHISQLLVGWLHLSRFILDCYCCGHTTESHFTQGLDYKVNV